MKILIGADLVPTKSNAEHFASENVDELLGNGLKEILSKADFRIFNLEVPLTDIETPIKKCGPALIAPTDTAVGIKSIGVDLVTLANNHVMDQGIHGLESTCECLRKHLIDFVGVGKNVKEASKSYVFSIEDKKIGVYACAEHEFSIATELKAGANPYDPLESFDHVSILKETCDYVIVLYHGGKEHYRYPSPELQRICRKFVDKGADLVICQHSHCIGCEEKYNDGTIVYGQGNFLFDNQDNEFWETGLLVEITGEFEVNYIPICKNHAAVRLATDEERQKILWKFEERSKAILNQGFVQKEYGTFAANMADWYAVALSGIKHRSLIVRLVNKLTGGKFIKFLVRRKYTEENKLMIRNYVECEAHRELLLRGVNKE